MLFRSAEAIAAQVSALFLSGEVDAVYLAYNEFLSPVSQKVTLEELLPIEEPAEEEQDTAPVAHLWEPGQDEVLAALLPRYVASQVWHAMLESVTSEQGARMSAMDNATKNASEMIARLTLLYNRTRQAGITKELMEIVSGAEALK